MTNIFAHFRPSPVNPVGQGPHTAQSLLKMGSTYLLHSACHPATTYVLLSPRTCDIFKMDVAVTQFVVRIGVLRKEKTLVVILACDIHVLGTSVRKDMHKSRRVSFWA